MSLDVLLKLIDEPDPCGLLFLIALGTAIGSKMIGLSRLRRWGYRIASGALILFTAYALDAYEPSTARDLVGIVLRALAVFGLTLGVSWTALAVVGFLLQATRPLGQGMREAADRQARERMDQERRKREMLDAERRADAEARSQLPATPRAEHVRRAIEQAKNDYDLDAEVIRSLALDTEEREAAVLQARQKLIRRLTEILK